MLTYQLDSTSSTNLYEQLYRCLKQDIVRGSLRSGEKLPSKRTLAKNLGVSIITVETAYAQLIAEGFIYSVPQKGFFVETLRQAELPTAQQSDSPPVQKVAVQADEGSAQAPYTIDFASNQTDEESFPFSVWAKLVRRVLSEDRAAVMTNSPAAGTLALRTAITRHLRAFRGLDAQPGQIVIGAGTEYLYGLLVQLFGFDRVFGTENPGYKKIQRVYRSFNVQCRQISLDKNGVQPADLIATGTDIIHISPSHQFPTGIVMPVTRRYELLEWAAHGKKRYIIEDDYDSEFRFSGKPIPTLQSIDPSEKVIYLNTFTKTLASTIRISYMVLPPHLAEQFRAQLGFYSCPVPTIEQLTLARFLAEGYFEKHINRMRKAYHEKRDLFISLLAAFDTAHKFEILEENSGLHFLLRLNESVPLVEFERTLRTARVRLQPLSAYYDEPQSGAGVPAGAERIFLVNYGALTKAEIEEAVKIITL